MTFYPTSKNMIQMSFLLMLCNSRTKICSHPALKFLLFECGGVPVRLPDGLSPALDGPACRRQGEISRIDFLEITILCLT